ncbi:MAG: hypothetical protein ABEJ31_00330 [Haloarculaceae archaeon]
MIDVDAELDADDVAILTVFAESEADALRAPQVADDLPLDTAAVRDRFDDLAESGLVLSVPDVRSGTAYQLTDDGVAALRESDRRVDTDLEAQATVASPATLPHDQETSDTPAPEPGQTQPDSPYEPPADFVEAFDPPGTPEQQERRRRALRAASEYLREHERVPRSEFVAEVFPNAQGAYEAPTDGWWSEVIQPGLEHLPGATTDGGGDVWRFDPEGAESGGTE